MLIALHCGIVKMKNLEQLSWVGPAHWKTANDPGVERLIFLFYTLVADGLFQP